MKNLEVYKATFDPDKTNDEKLKQIFDYKPTKALWFSIKSGHVTDQYFNDMVLEAGEKIKDLGSMYGPSFDVFIKCLGQLPHMFGRCSGQVSFSDTTYLIDNEFWLSVYESAFGSRCFRVDVKEAP